MRTIQQENSYEAFLLKTDKEKDELKILKALKEKGSMTYKEIAQSLNWLDPNKVSRRTCEMERKGLIKSLGKKMCPIAKRNCTIYDVI